MTVKTAGEGMHMYAVRCIRIGACAGYLLRSVVLGPGLHGDAGNKGILCQHEVVVPS